MDHAENTSQDLPNGEPADIAQDASSDSSSDLQWSRRNFLRSAAAAGAGLILPVAAEAAAKKPAAKPTAKPAAKTPPKPEEIKIAMVGPGNQGRNLLVQCLRIPGVRFVAICDIWPYNEQYAAGIL
ncbi:MAG: twin-arginine translocation signal domain-containing protein, partial [Armatimonadota bacterium]|nr:twin-arginine translocation signal domain-containing protein [Armatimonadota bacterium]